MVPHLSARLVRDRSHLDEVLAQVLAAMGDARTQFERIGITGCFDPATIGWWIGAVRARGTRLPIWIGMARLCHVLARMMTRQFKPSLLLDGLAQVVIDPDAKVGGFHLYTFNEVARTERWRQQTLSRLTHR